MLKLFLDFGQLGQQVLVLLFQGLNHLFHFFTKIFGNSHKHFVNHTQGVFLNELSNLFVLEGFIEEDVFELRKDDEAVVLNGTVHLLYLLLEEDKVEKTRGTGLFGLRTLEGRFKKDPGFHGWPNLNYKVQILTTINHNCLPPLRLNKIKYKYYFLFPVDSAITITRLAQTEEDSFPLDGILTLLLLERRLLIRSEEEAPIISSHSLFWHCTLQTTEEHILISKLVLLVSVCESGLSLTAAPRMLRFRSPCNRLPLLGL